jgi:alginate O-acetyltransferase complex protein AlgI
LSRWLRDYLYIPLGGSHGAPWTRYTNLLITMLLGGLWHGAHWNFVIWGGLHGLALVVNHLIRQRSSPMMPSRALGQFVWTPLCWVLTFTFVVASWVFFRASTTTAAFEMLRAMGEILSPRPDFVATFATGSGALLGLAAAIAFLAPNSIAIERALASREPKGLAAGALAGAAASAALLAGLAMPAPAPFLYFNF